MDAHAEGGSDRGRRDAGSGHVECFVYRVPVRSVEWPPSVLVEKVALSTSDGAVSHLTLRVSFILTVNHRKMGQIYSQGTHGSKSQNKTKRICEPVASWFFEKPPRFGFCPNPRAHGEGAVARRRPAGCPNMFAEFEDDDDYDEVDEDQQKHCLLYTSPSPRD